MKRKFQETITYETFDYYKVEPLDFNELLNKDKELLLNLVKDKSLYVLIIDFFSYENENDVDMFEFLKSQNDEPEKDFKFEVDFQNIITQHKRKLSDGIMCYGICEIDIDFYLNNYCYFNRTNNVYLIISDKKYLDMINYEIDNNISYLLKDKNNIISLLCLTDFYELLKNISYKFENKVSFISFNDDEEFKTIKITTLN